MGFGDLNEGAKGDYFGKPEPWVKHMSSKRETVFSNCADLVTGEDLRTASSGIYFNADKCEWVWPIMGVGTPRKVLGVFVVFYNGQGDLMTSVEGPDA